jgi:hypothetical protein
VLILVWNVLHVPQALPAALLRGQAVMTVTEATYFPAQVQAAVVALDATHTVSFFFFFFFLYLSLCVPVCLPLCLWFFFLGFLSGIHSFFSHFFLLYFFSASFFHRFALLSFFTSPHVIILHI